MLGLFLVLPVLAVHSQVYADATPMLIGIAVGIYGLTQALLQIPFGLASDRWGRRPVVLFGLLVMPPLVARPVASSMGRFLVLSSLVGLVSSTGGVWLSFRFDWPLGPSVVVAAAVLVVPALPRILARGR